MADFDVEETEQITAGSKYVVKQRDSLAGISITVYGSDDYMNLLADFNGIRDPRKLKVGQVLTIPSADLKKVTATDINIVETQPFPVSQGAVAQGF